MRRFFQFLVSSIVGFSVIGLPVWMFGPNALTAIAAGLIYVLLCLVDYVVLQARRHPSERTSPIRFTRQNDRMVVELFGKWYRNGTPGLDLRWPIMTHGYIRSLARITQDLPDIEVRAGIDTFVIANWKMTFRFLDDGEQLEFRDPEGHMRLGGRARKGLNGNLFFAVYKYRTTADLIRRIIEIVRQAGGEVCGRMTDYDALTRDQHQVRQATNAELNRILLEDGVKVSVMLGTPLPSTDYGREIVERTSTRGRRAEEVQTLRHADNVADAEGITLSGAAEATAAQAIGNVTPEAFRRRLLLDRADALREAGRHGRMVVDRGGELHPLHLQAELQIADPNAPQNPGDGGNPPPPPNNPQRPRRGRWRRGGGNNS